jgi:DNA-directed RNA polymerase subunit K
MAHENAQTFTKYETARIIGARALQIAMDAPLLLKLSDSELKELRFDALRIAEKELDANVLPIAINRPTPRRARDKLEVIKEEKVSDEEIVEKEKAVEKELVEGATELGLVPGDEVEDYQDEAVSSAASPEEQ